VPPHRLLAVRVSAAVVGLVLALLAAGCTQTVPGSAVAAPEPLPAPAAASGPLPGAPPTPLSADEVSAVTVAALQEFWRAQFPAAFGREWTDITDFVPVETTRPGASTPPCLRRAADLADQAFYCPAADVVAWDADRLLPQQVDRFGAAGAVVVLAHEVGHAVHNRLGIDAQRARSPGRYPTILFESMADCFAGVALAHFVDQPVPGLPIGPDERDQALLALVGFRDPLGVDAGDASAHGNAFDRVSAFQTGYADGAARCAGMTLDNQVFTQRRFGSADDLARRGNLPLDALLEVFEPDARPWFSSVAATRVPGWQAPPLDPAPSCPGRAAAAQGPAVFCAADGAVAVNAPQLAAIHQQFGDYAATMELASRYGLATLNAIGARPVGPAAGSATVCLSGAYTGHVINGENFTLSPGDLDEAVQVLLAGDWVARDSGGRADPAEHGFDRVARFRAGFLEGPAGCLPPA
jgi:predicted metalloprotease